MSCELTACSIWHECDKMLGDELKPRCADKKQLPPDIARIIEDIESINEHILMTSFDANSLRALAEYIKAGA